MIKDKIQITLNEDPSISRESNLQLKTNIC